MGKITRFVGLYTFLSNFYPVPIVGRGDLMYMSVEAAYQAGKPSFTEEGDGWVQRIRDAPTAGRSKTLGRRCPLGDHWTAEYKIALMHSLVLQKFSYDELKGMLLMTEDAEIVEGNTWGDTFWGQSGGVGDNHLGEILMNIREQLRGDRS